jgi:hypothetical protein
LSSNHQWPFGDLKLYFWLLNFGKGYVLDEIFSFYRIHNTGVWTSNSRQKSIEKLIIFYSLSFKCSLNRNYDYQMFEKSIQYLTCLLIKKKRGKRRW